MIVKYNKRDGIEINALGELLITPSEYYLENSIAHSDFKFSDAIIDCREHKIRTLWNVFKWLNGFKIKPKVVVSGYSGEDGILHVKEIKEKHYKDVVNTTKDYE